ncbi:MAG: hypothetical protein EOP06_10425, partial [Proteobacteria bacterium]
MLSKLRTMKLLGSRLPIAFAILINLLSNAQALACSLEPDHPFDRPVGEVVRSTDNIYLIEPVSSKPQLQLFFWRPTEFYSWTFRIVRTLKGNSDKSTIQINDVRPLTVGSPYSSRATVSPSCDFVIVGFKMNEKYIYFEGSKTFINYQATTAFDTDWSKLVENTISDSRFVRLKIVKTEDLLVRC